MHQIIFNPRYLKETYFCGKKVLKLPQSPEIQNTESPGKHSSSYSYSVFRDFQCSHRFSVLYLHFQDSPVKSLFPKVPTFYTFFHSISPNFSEVWYFRLTSAFVTLAARLKRAAKSGRKISTQNSLLAFVGIRLFCLVIREFGREFG